MINKLMYQPNLQEYVRPKIYDFLPTTFLSRNGITSIEDVKKNPVILIYICCANTSDDFLPTLLKFYEEVNKETKNLEVIMCYIGNDKPKTVEETMSCIPWLWIDPEVNNLQLLHYNLVTACGNRACRSSYLFVARSDGFILDGEVRNTINYHGTSIMSFWWPTKPSNQPRSKLQEMASKFLEEVEMEDYEDYKFKE